MVVVGLVLMLVSVGLGVDSVRIRNLDHTHLAHVRTVLPIVGLGVIHRALLSADVDKPIVLIAFLAMDAMHGAFPRPLISLQCTCY